MSLDLVHFTPGPALAGGLLIGAAAALLIVLVGRVAGISGIVGGLLPGASSTSERRWRIAFLVGLLAAPAVVRLAGQSVWPQVAASNAVLVLAGLLVGVGTRVAEGCTSGHGVCGLSRLSWRSAVATVVFMAAGFATVALLRHGMGAQ